ncbi:VWA-like domain-containing protein [uncultured Sulfitobacter sp.]|uniref:vWA domain-containing protein n=1 Tax=uncultured Sulfitobacter sp. TaxID=191468 RepID=UPI00260C18D6|nr:VWA-like domain-containing protein [uncultured Sulfitobacter sp.]
MIAGAAHSRRASPALRALAEADPALAALSLWCTHRDAGETRTEGSTITYGPDFTELALHEQIGLAAHHILHVALRHSARLADLRTRLGGGFDAALYTLAADAVVNEALLLADHALPRPAVTLTGLLSKALGKTVSPEVALAAWDVDRLYYALTRAQDQAGDAQGRARAYAQAQGFEPDLEAGADEAAAENDMEQAARWRQHMSRAMDVGRQAGRGVGRIGHRIADVPTPRTAWEIVLRRALTRAVMIQPQPSTQRPARRWIAGAAQAALAGSPTPGFEPGMRLYTDVPRIALALDASSSIDDARLAVFWAEVSGIARRQRAELHLIVFDDQIRSHVQIDPNQQRFEMPQLPRGGGTDFCPVIAKAREIAASALVVFTDLEGDAGPPPRGVSVIWAVPDAGTVQAPFGQVIDLAR